MSIAQALPSSETAAAARNGSFAGSGQRRDAEGTNGALPGGTFAMLFQTVSGGTAQAVRPPATTDPATVAAGEAAGSGGQGASAGSGRPITVDGAEGSDRASGEASGEAASSASAAAVGTGADAASAALPSAPAPGLDRRAAPAIGGGHPPATPLASPNAVPGSTLPLPGQGAAAQPSTTASGGSVLASGVLPGTVQPATGATPVAATSAAAPLTAAATVPTTAMPTAVAATTTATATVTSAATSSAIMSATAPATPPTPDAPAVPASATSPATVAASGTASVPAGASALPSPEQPPRTADGAAPARPAAEAADEMPDVRLTDRRPIGVAPMTVIRAPDSAAAGTSSPGTATVAVAGPTTVPVSPDPAAVSGSGSGTGTSAPTTTVQPGAHHPTAVVAALAAAPTILLPGQLRAMSHAGAAVPAPSLLEPTVSRAAAAAGAGSGGTMNARLRTGLSSAGQVTVPRSPVNGEAPGPVPMIASAEALARRAGIATDAALAARSEAPVTPGAMLPGTSAPDGTLQAPVATSSTVALTGSAPATMSIGPSGTGASAALSPGASTVSSPVTLTGADAPRDISDTIRLTLAQGRQVARIDLTPVELGTMTVELEQRQDGRLTVALHSPVNATRDLVESMIPRLREQLANDGFTSVSVGVGDRGEEGERRGARHGPLAAADPDRNAGDSRGNGGERSGGERAGGERAGGERAGGQRPEAERGGERGTAGGHSGTTDASPSSRTRSSGSLAAGSNRVLDAWI